MGEWINVKDRLPEKGVKVLCYDTSRIYIAYRFPIENEYNEHWGICEDSDCSCIGCTGAITHWMPLPEPPNKDEPKKIIPCKFGCRKLTTKCDCCGRVVNTTNIRDDDGMD